MSGIAALLLPLVGCGGGGGEGADTGAVREALVDALTAPDVHRARLYIDTAEWLTNIEDPSASEYHASTEEQKRQQAQRFFDLIQTVQDYTTLRDAPAIRAAVDAGTVEILPQVRVAHARFQGPDAEGTGVVAFKAKLRLDLDDRWRLVHLEPDF